VEACGSPHLLRAQLLWQGDEALADALELVAVAEAAAERAAAAARGSTRGVPDPGEAEQPAEAFVWRQPLMRPAGNEEQVRQPGRSRVVPASVWHPARLQLRFALVCSGSSSPELLGDGSAALLLAEPVDQSSSALSMRGLQTWRRIL